MKDTIKTMILIAIITILSTFIFKALIEIEPNADHIKMSYPEIAIDITEDFGTPKCFGQYKIIRRKVTK